MVQNVRIIADLPYGVLNRGNRSACWDRQIPLGPLWEQYRRTVSYTHLIDDEAGTYYTQRWYIARRDQGSVSLCDYYPPRCV